MPQRPIRFFHRGRIAEVEPGAPTRTVLEWVREDLRAAGTKEGCAEGDCGACTVVLGRLDADDRLELRPVNACIQFLPTLDGQALFTIEDLKARDGTLHPVQQAMVQTHGSQCGFCTPGIVMSLWASYERHGSAGTVATRQQLADDLSGNLCRCTGYRPILDAGQRMFEPAPVRLDRAPVEAALRELRRDPPLAIEAREGSYWAPRTLDEFARLREQHPDARILAGGTDVGLWVTKQFKALPKLLYIGAVAELERIVETGGGLRIGAAAPLEPAWRALVARWPGLRDLWLRFASPPVRSVGTMGGNVANGSPIGDSAPALIALGAALVLRRGAAQRRVKLEDFYLDYMRNALEPGEFVEAIELPGPEPGVAVHGYKVAKRYDCDISALSLGAWIALDDGRVRDVRLAYGGMAAIVRRATAAEAALRGAAWSEASVQAAAVALAQDFQPLTDMRASAGYRMQAAGQLIHRLWLQTRPENPLPETALNVWAREVTA